MAESRPNGALLLIGLVLLVVGLIFGGLVRRYGIGLLLTPSSQRLTLSVEQHRTLLETHRFVLIGGSHRGGTTIFWKLLAAHPSISGFAESGVPTDFAEGAFLQTVMPTFGVGAELMGAVRRRDVGLGRYAFSPSAHMTERHALNTPASSLKLVSEWGFHWNMSKPVLLEKTPTDMLTSRLLQALLTPADTTFIFVTRHPLAVALAHKKWACCAGMRVPTLALHWLVSHRVLAGDLPRLRSAQVLRYEDLARRPLACVRRVFGWLGLSTSKAVDAAVATVSPDANRKYESQYCREHLREPQQLNEHCAMGGALQPAVLALGLGYDLRVGNALGFSCIGRRLAASERANRSGARPGGVCGGIPSDSNLLEAMRAHEAMVLRTDAPADGAAARPLGLAALGGAPARRRRGARGIDRDAESRRGVAPPRAGICA